MTNFYFEIEDADDDVTNEDGEVLEKGKRKLGVSKEEHHQPLVQMGLFMDDVIDKYHGLTQIEDQFRVMKGDLETRPVYVRTPEHIDAHLLICLIALIMMRIIQKRIRDMDPGKEKDVYWNVGMSGERIQRARYIFSKF